MGAVPTVTAGAVTVCVDATPPGRPPKKTSNFWSASAPNAALARACANDVAWAEVRVDSFAGITKLSPNCAEGWVNHHSLMYSLKVGKPVDGSVFCWIHWRFTAVPDATDVAGGAT